MKKEHGDLLRILVVDDEQAILDSYQEVLCDDEMPFGLEPELKQLAEKLFGERPKVRKKVSFDLVQCRQGEEAVSAVKKALEQRKPFAVAFIDVRLPPGRDGVWAAEHIRAEDPCVEIVMVTAYSDVDPAEIAHRVVPADKLLYIQKPFHPQEIRQFATALSAKWTAERLLRSTNTLLETRVAEKTKALEEKNAQLRGEMAERKKAHAELNQIFKAAVPLCVIDKNYTMLRVNDTFCSFFLQSKENVFGKKCYHVLESSLCRTVGCPMQKILGGLEKSEHEEMKRRADGSILSCVVTAIPYRDVNGELIGIVENFTDITERKKSEETLQKREAALEVKSRHLEEANTALKVLLRQRDDHKAEIEQRVLSNLKELILPHIETLKQCGLGSRQAGCVDILESNLKELISPFSQKLSAEHLSLTPKEIQVANLVKEGKTTKEIAELLSVSTNAIVFHRYHIRKNLGLKNQKVNLRSYLSSLS